MGIVSRISWLLVVAERFPRSHIDTTAVQALIDTRTEVEKWADHPIEVSSISSVMLDI